MLDKLKNGIGIFSLFWKILNKKQQMLFFLVFVSILFCAMLEALGVSILIPFTQAIFMPEELMKKPVVHKIIRLFGISDEISFVVFITVCVITFYIFKNTYLVLSVYWQQKYRCDIQKYVSVATLDNYLHSQYILFIKTNSSKLLQNVINDADGMMSLINSIFSILTQVLVILLIIVFLFVIDSFLSLCLFLSLILVLAMSVLILGRPIKNTGVRLREYGTFVIKSALQAINGIKEIIVYGKQDFFSREYEKAYQKKTNNDIKSCVYTSIPSRLIEGICISALALSLCLKQTSGGISVTKMAQLSAFAMAVFKLLPSVSLISNSLSTLILSYPVLISVHNNIKEFANNKKLLSNNNENIEFKNTIRFDNVSFSYEGSQKIIFSNVCLTINKGDTIGIVGPSGAGKTTFVDVLIGLLQNTAGNIYIDNVPLSEKNLFAWKNKIAYVPQTAYLLDDTVIANVVFGQDKKNINTRDVSAALREAVLEEYVSGLQNGLMSVVGERGISMSGGQRQRLSIARALYVDPEIIVFDEATSALDEKTEKEIMKSIGNLIGKKTLILIAHRTSTLKKCNRIFEIKDNTVTEKIVEI